MSERDPTATNEDKLLKYAGYAGIAIAVVLAVAVTAVSLGPGAVPANLVLGTVVFTVVMILIGAVIQLVDTRRTYRYKKN